MNLLNIKTIRITIACLEVCTVLILILTLIYLAPTILWYLDLFLREITDVFIHNRLVNA